MKLTRDSKVNPNMMMRPPTIRTMHSPRIEKLEYDLDRIFCGRISLVLVFWSGIEYFSQWE